MKVIAALGAVVMAQGCGGGPDMGDPSGANAALRGADERGDSEQASATLLDPASVDGNYRCPAGSWSLKVDPFSNGTFTDGKLRVHVTNFNGKTFNWSSNIGVDIVAVKGGPVSALFIDDEATSGFATPEINPNNGKYYGLSHVTFCYDREPPTGKKGACPTGSISYELFSPGAGTFTDGKLSVTLTDYGTSSFKWSSNMGVDAVHVAAGDVYNHWNHSPAALSGYGNSVHPTTGVEHPLTFIKFCYDGYVPVGDDDDDDDDDVVLGPGGNFLCPPTMHTLKVDPGSNGIFSDGRLVVKVARYNGYSFNWYANKGVDIVAVKGGPTSEVFFHDEATAGSGWSAYNPNSGYRYEISHITFCYDKDNPPPGKKDGCPYGTTTYELYSPGAGTFGDGAFQVILSEYGSDSFKWSSNKGVDALHVEAGDHYNTTLYSPEAYSGTGSSVSQSTYQSHPLTFIKFCY